MISGSIPANEPVVLYISRNHLSFQGFSGSYRKFMEFSLRFCEGRKGSFMGKPSRLGVRIGPAQAIGLLGQMVRGEENF
jgi:hypothetical protein